MSLFNKLTYYVLWIEVLFYLLSLIPLSFIAAKTRKDAMNWFGKISSNEYAVWTARIALLIISGVFADNVLRLFKLESETHDHGHHHNHHSGSSEYTMELQSKYQRFYSQRNVYMSAFTLFMILVLYRRFMDVYRIIQLELDISSIKATQIPPPVMPASKVVKADTAHNENVTLTNRNKNDQKEK
ncbi:protein localization to endoplasmic reticulum exit site [Batrachochytrium dendrobatidis]|nr:protein localization to endoplasmic reticulum exit site [Batrachochytrium dendrobatidis]